MDTPETSTRWLCQTDVITSTSRRARANTLMIAQTRAQTIALIYSVTEKTIAVSGKAGGGVVFTLTPTPPLSLRLLFIAGSLPLTPSSRERSRENKHALEGDSYEEQARGSLDPLLHVFEWWNTNTFPNNIHTPSSRMCLITSPLKIGWLLPAAFRASSEQLHLSIT